MWISCSADLRRVDDEERRFTQSSKVSFSPRVDLAIFADCGAVSVASRHTNHHLRTSVPMNRFEVDVKKRRLRVYKDSICA